MSGRPHTREDSGIRLDTEGNWWHDGERVTHPRIIDAWNRGIDRDEKGRYIVRFGHDWAVVTVDDVPIQVVTVRVTRNAVTLSLSDGTEETLDPGTLRLSKGVLYCEVRNASMLARFSRSAHFVLGDQLTETDAGYVLVIGDRTFPVPLDRS